MITVHVSLAVAALPPTDGMREQIRARAVAEASALEEGGTIRIPGVARYIVGTKQVASGARPSGAD